MGFTAAFIARMINMFSIWRLNNFKTLGQNTDWEPIKATQTEEEKQIWRVEWQWEEKACSQSRSFLPLCLKQIRRDFELHSKPLSHICNNRLSSQSFLCDPRSELIHPGGSPGVYSICVWFLWTEREASWKLLGLTFFKDGVWGQVNIHIHMQRCVQESVQLWEIQ